ncbi:hypothetical protein KCP71_20285 [Salmonella enterica subsp. enterica]|nr:hypothetical protein KCP71_20285 [Salmonella enterica subsp. enterica]
MLSKSTQQNIAIDWKAKVARLTLCATTPAVAQRAALFEGGVIAPADIVNSVITNRCGSARVML